MEIRLSVAMCTFNGERYLQEQLDSILAQTLLPSEIVIGDDKSTDQTIRILEEFAERSPVPVTIIRRSEQRGHGQNFLDTAAQSACEWVAFCDQDDVWLPHKLAEAAEQIIKHEDMLMVNQRALLCDEKLAVRNGELFPADKSPGIHVAQHLRYPPVWPGFLMTVRSDLIRNYDFNLRPSARGSKVGHDRWLFMLAAELGTYVVTERPAVLYRRHERALTGDYDPLVRAKDRRASFHNWLLIYEELARDSVRAFTELAIRTNDPSVRKSLKSAAQRYAKAAEVLALRSILYENASWTQRIAAYFGSLRKAHDHHPFYSLGARDLVKDAAAVFGLGR